MAFIFIHFTYKNKPIYLFHDIDTLYSWVKPINQFYVTHTIQSQVQPINLFQLIKPYKVENNLYIYFMIYIPYIVR